MYRSPLRRDEALRQAAKGIKGSRPDLADSIYQCIHKKDGRILDEASEELGTVRVQRQVGAMHLSCNFFMTGSLHHQTNSYLYMSWLPVEAFSILAKH